MLASAQPNEVEDAVRGTRDCVPDEYSDYFVLHRRIELTARNPPQVCRTKVKVESQDLTILSAIWQ